MTVVFDKWDELDPALLCAKLSEATGVVLDKYAVLDPARMRKLIEDALGVSISEDAMIDTRKMIAELQVIVNDLDDSGGNFLQLNSLNLQLGVQDLILDGG